MNNETNIEKAPFRIYCNAVQIGTSHFDFSLILSESSSLGDRIFGEIKMSPEHAKVLAHMLLENVKNYEELFGPIPEMNQERLQRLQAEGKISVDGEYNG